MNQEWVICQGCGLGHTARVEGICPRCKADTRALSSAAAAPYAPPSPRATFSAGSGEGSAALGFCLAFFLGLWGLIGALVLGKEETKKGAGYGFATRLVLTVIVVGIAMAAG